jgi:hypothetical protein
MNHERGFLTSVDEVLDVLGEASKNTIYYHLENTFHLPRETIPERPEVLAHALEVMLGKGGVLLQRRILTRFYEKMGLPFEEHQGFTFADYVREARRSNPFVQTNSSRRVRRQII